MGSRFQTGLLLMPYHPAETPEHYRRVNQVSIGFVVFLGALNAFVGLLLLFYRDTAAVSLLTDVVGSLHASFANRLHGLRMLGPAAPLQFVSGLILFFPEQMIVTGYLFLIYRNEVVRTGKMNRFQPGYHLGMLIAAPVYAVFAYFLFFQKLSEELYAAFQTAIFGPIGFPFLIVVCNIVMSMCVMNIIVFFLKYTGRGNK